MRRNALVRFGIIVACAVSAIGIVPVANADDPSGSAKRSDACRIGRFSPTIESTFAEPLPDDDYRVEYRTSGTSTLDCPNRPLLGVDVWEHAYYLTLVETDDAGVYRVGGRARVRIATGDLNGDGAPDEQTLATKIRGSGRCTGDVCRIIYDARGGNDDVKLELRHRGTLDIRGEEWRDFQAYGVWRNEW